MPTVSRRCRRGAGAATVVVAALTLAGCSSIVSARGGPGVTTVEVVGRDSGFDLATDEAVPSLPAGHVTVRFRNMGPDNHQLQLARLNDGVRLADVEAAASAGDVARVLTLVTLAGGANTVAPGVTQPVSVDLTPGTWVMMRLMPGGIDAGRSAAVGKVRPFRVTSKRAKSVAPVADGDITLRDDTVVLPDGFGGTGRFKVTNAGTAPHELAIVRLEETKAPDDLRAFVESRGQGRPPATPAGGMAGLSPGASAWVDFDLDPGSYVALCAVPDPVTGVPHVARGAAQPFTVS